MHKTIIFHIDVNAAFLSWEAVYRLKVLGESNDLRDIPSAVGGDQEQRKGVILAKSFPAKRQGVQTGEPIVAALSKCPQLMIVKPHYAYYVECSKALMDLLEEYSPVVERYSIDEAFIDMTGTEKLHGEPLAIAHKIKDRIYKELGFTVNIGISTNKLLAKMAGEFEKPNRIHTLFPEEIEKKMWPLPIRELFFVGGATEKKLKALGITTIGKLAKADPKLLKVHLKKQGERIHQYANGMDDEVVMFKSALNKGYGNSTTIPYDVSSAENAKLILLSLCETVCARLRADGVKAGCLSVTIVDMYFERASHQKALLAPTNITHEIYTCISMLFEELWNHKTPIRQLGVQASKVTTEETYQCNLFDTPQYDKYEKLDQAIDQIRNKYGKDAVIRAPFLNPKLDFMASERLNK